MDCSMLDDDELVELLFTQEDRLSRAAVDEFLKRGERMVPLLAKIVSNQYIWSEDGPRWWSVVHAVYILGAIAAPSTVIPLLRALRWADALDCDWVTDPMPDIFARVGAAAYPRLKDMAADQTNGVYLRSIVMNSLVLICRDNANLSQETGKFLFGIFQDEEEDWDVRQFTGNSLLDLRLEEYREDLKAFGRKEKELKSKSGFYLAHFFEEDVEKVYTMGPGEDKCGGRDWLSFYDEKEINERQDRWRREVEKEPVEEVGYYPDDNFFETPEPYVRHTYVGRNDRCPCGSGKKYKKCCLGTGKFE